MTILAALQLCHEEDTYGVTTTPSERWLTGLKFKQVKIHRGRHRKHQSSMMQPDGA
ncbi:hypothetical protein DPMN_001299 [Dreissena polymorpha]|uniref:Uncharacterized protein n=1 Tax=Dreissena polymorpha TaxID=45954 RepID=A0A9D4MH18_DREPO|nr:hypothetical protein DPMN_001299 [Dreissena polymorpha]